MVSNRLRIPVSWVKVLCVTLHSDPNVCPSWPFLTMESTLRYVICSSRLKPTRTATLQGFPWWESVPFASGCNTKGRDKMSTLDELRMRMGWSIHVVLLLGAATTSKLSFYIELAFDKGQCQWWCDSPLPLFREVLKCTHAVDALYADLPLLTQHCY